MKALLIFSLVLLQVNYCEFDHTFPENSVLLNQAIIPVWYTLHQGEEEEAAYYYQKIADNFELLLEESHSAEGGFLEYALSDLQLLDLSFKEKRYEHAKELSTCVLDDLHLWHTLNANYYFDKIWHFKQLHDEFSFTVKDYFLCKLEWEELQSMADELEEAWANVTACSADFSGYQVSLKQATEFEKTKQKVSECLATLIQQMEEADRSLTATDCNEIEENLPTLISYFGYFDGGSI